MFLSDLLNSLRKTYGNTVTTGDLRGYAAAHGVSYRSIYKKIAKYKTGRGKWNLTVSQARKQLEKAVAAPAATPVVERNLIPEKDDTFVKFGSFSDIKKIISSKLFYPTFITGLSYFHHWVIR